MANISNAIRIACFLLMSYRVLLILHHICFFPVHPFQCEIRCDWAV